MEHMSGAMGLVSKELNELNLTAAYSRIEVCVSKYEYMYCKPLVAKFIPVHCSSIYRFTYIVILNMLTRKNGNTGGISFFVSSF